MRFRGGGKHPHGFMFVAAPEKEVVDAGGPCEAKGAVVAKRHRASGVDGETLENMHETKEACKDDCKGRGSFYFSYKFHMGKSSCRCGAKGKSFAWLLSKASTTRDPWFTKEQLTPCSEASKDWCTEGTKCKKCMLINTDTMDENNLRKHNLGDCRQVMENMDCVSAPIEEGEWLEVSNRQCFQSCQLDSFDGMNGTFMENFKIGQCLPLMSWNRTVCEDWSLGKWRTVSRGACSKPGSWNTIGHFEDFLDQVKGGWKFEGEANVQRSDPGSQTGGLIAWAELQLRCDVSVEEKAPGAVSVLIPTGPQADYTLLFQAALSADHDGDGVAYGSVRIQGNVYQYSVKTKYDGKTSFEWTPVSVSFTATNFATLVYFETEQGQCLRVREVILSRGESFYTRGAETKWQDDKALTRAFNRIGCPNPEPKIKKLEYWRGLGEVKTLASMWKTCNSASEERPVVGEQTVCCGANSVCKPRRCTPRISIWDEPGAWTSWITLKDLKMSQSSTVGEHKAEHAGDSGHGGKKCAQTRSEERPFWNVTLANGSEVAAIRLTHCSACNLSARLPVLIYLDSVPCTKPIYLRKKKETEVLCVGPAKEVKVELQGMGELGLCQVGVQLRGRVTEKKPGRCPYEMNRDNFYGTGNPEIGYLEQGQWLRTKRRFKRPLTLQAEIKADKPGCFIAAVFPGENYFSGYALQMGDFGTDTVGLPGQNLRAETGPNDKWTKIKIKVRNDGKIYYYMGRERLYKTIDATIQQGYIQFAAPCTGGFIRNIHVDQNYECSTHQRSCRAALKLDQAKEHWHGDGNAAFMRLEKGQFLETNAIFARPLSVRAQVTTEMEGCLSIQVFGGQKGKEDPGYELSTGVRRYKARVEPGGYENAVGPNNKWHWLEVDLEAGGNVTYYLNHERIYSVLDTTRTYGTIKLLATCVGLEARNVVVETVASCHHQVEDIQGYQVW